MEYLVLIWYLVSSFEFNEKLYWNKYFQNINENIAESFSTRLFPLVLLESYPFLYLSLAKPSFIIFSSLISLEYTCYLIIPSIFEKPNHEVVIGAKLYLLKNAKRLPTL